MDARRLASPRRRRPAPPPARVGRPPGGANRPAPKAVLVYAAPGGGWVPRDVGGVCPAACRGQRGLSRPVRRGPLGLRPEVEPTGHGLRPVRLAPPRGRQPTRNRTPGQVPRRPGQPPAGRRDVAPPPGPQRRAPATDRRRLPSRPRRVLGRNRPVGAGRRLV